MCKPALIGISCMPSCNRGQGVWERLQGVGSVALSCMQAQRQTLQADGLHGSTERISLTKVAQLLCMDSCRLRWRQCRRYTNYRRPRSGDLPVNVLRRLKRNVSGLSRFAYKCYLSLPLIPAGACKISAGLLGRGNEDLCSVRFHEMQTADINLTLMTLCISCYLFPESGR